MRYNILIVSALLAACGGASSTTSPTVTDPWIGTWNLVSVNGVALPADVVVLGYSERVVRRTLDLVSPGLGIWTDSSLSALNCVPPSSKTTMCNASGGATFVWASRGDTLIFGRNGGTTVGYVVAAKTFVKQADGSLLKTDDSQTEIYRRQ